MAYSEVTYPGQTGVTTDYAISFQYIDQSNIVAEVNGVNAPFAFVSDFLIRMTTAPIGDLVIKRSTPINSAEVVFVDGSVQRADEHNKQNTQLIFAAQEASDKTNNAIQKSSSTTDIEGRRLINVADPVDAQDAVTKTYVDAEIAAGDVQLRADVAVDCATAVDAATRADASEVNAAASAVAAADSASDAQDSADAALAAKLATDSLNMPSSLVGEAGKLLTVKTTEDGFETASPLGFYGLRLNGAKLTLETGEGPHNADDFETWTIAPPGVTFSVDANGHVLISF